MRTLNEVLTYQLQYICNAESRLVEGLSIVARNTTDRMLNEAFEIQLENAKQYKKKIEDISDALDINSSGVDCSVVSCFIQEIQELLKLSTEEEVLNMSLIAQTQKIVYFKISIYNTALVYSSALGYTKISAQLNTILNQEKLATTTLNSLAKKISSRK